MSPRHPVLIEWSADDAAYVARVPALPGCIATGETLEAAARELTTAIALWLASAENHGDPIPSPDTAKLEVELPAWAAASLARRAALIGVPAQDLVKVWIVERLSAGGVLGTQPRR